MRVPGMDIDNLTLSWVVLYRLADPNLNPKWTFQALSRTGRRMRPAQTIAPAAVHPRRNAACSGG